MPTPENPYAGQGPVVLDIGGDIGALVVTTSATMDGVELEIRPADPASSLAGSYHHAQHSHDHLGVLGRPHQHDEHSPHLVHVAVVGRPCPGGVIYSAVFADLRQGSYELSEKPFGDVRLTVDVAGGEVTRAAWG